VYSRRLKNPQKLKTPELCARAVREVPREGLDAARQIKAKWEIKQEKPFLDRERKGLLKITYKKKFMR
jgi:hypothetical protein